MAEKKKRPTATAHERAIELLTKSSSGFTTSYLVTFVTMYKLGTIVPVKAIPELIEALQKAFDSVPSQTKKTLEEPFELAIQQLSEQLANTLKEVTSIAGSIFEVDASDEACQRFGFKPGQRVSIAPDWDENQAQGIVVGVAPVPEIVGSNELWIAFDKNDGKVSSVTNPRKNLKAL